MLRILQPGGYAAALAGLLLAGCATRYHAPSRNEPCAYLEALAPAWVASIDGRQTSFFTPKSSKRFRVRPGSHVIEARYEALELRYLTARTSRSRGPIVPVASDVPLPLDQPLLTWNSLIAETVVPVRSQRSVLMTFTAEAGHNYFLHDGRMDDDWKPFIDEDRELKFIEFDLGELGIQPGS